VNEAGKETAMDYLAVTVRGVSTPICVHAPGDADKAAVLAQGFMKDGHGYPAHRIDAVREVAEPFGISIDPAPVADG
jgi:hypothetical protein